MKRPYTLKFQKVNTNLSTAVNNFKVQKMSFSEYFSAALL